MTSGQIVLEYLLNLYRHRNDGGVLYGQFSDHYGFARLDLSNIKSIKFSWDSNYTSNNVRLINSITDTTLMNCQKDVTTNIESVNTTADTIYFIANSSYSSRYWVVEYTTMDGVLHN